jgi:predicted O-linked N-acetylglucosamine transferase (SPINDLY family)
MRGRQSAAMLALLGLRDLVAGSREDYLAIASRLVTEASWRAELRSRIRSVHDRLFGVREALEPLQRVFHSGVPAR